MPLRIEAALFFYSERLIMTEQYIREYPTNKILGIIETAPNGDQTARDYTTRKILGYYRAQFNQTTDFIGNVIATGNCVVALIYNKK